MMKFHVYCILLAISLQLCIVNTLGDMTAARKDSQSIVSSSQYLDDKTTSTTITTITPNTTTTTSTTQAPNTTTSSTTTQAPKTTTTSTTTSTTSSTTSTTSTPLPTTSTTTTPPPPKPTTTPKPEPDHKFDGPSFIGGMILTLGLMAIAFVSWKFYKARTERNYHTL